MGRLQIQDMGGGSGGDHGAGGRRHYHHPRGDKKLKVVRLSELINVLRLPPNAEACPMENMSAFCVETQDRTMVFAALKDECMDWVEKLSHSTFQRGGDSHSSQLHMEENQIYASADDVSEFWIVIQKTDAATRCGLQGSYWLQVGQEALLLKETQTKNTVREWPYELLRRYGKDKLALTIEAGRRCDSGPGTFTFETQQAETIFSLIKSTIKRKTASPSNQSQENEKVITNIQTHSPLPEIPDMSSMAAFLETKLRTQERKCAAAEESAHGPEDLAGQSECVSAQPAPVTLMPLPMIPTHDIPSVGQQSGLSDGIYADPAECLQSVPKPQPTAALYLDPATVLPLKPPTEPGPPLPNSSSSHPCFNIDHPDSVYSEVFDKVSSVQNKQAVQSTGKPKCVADDEPIYTEPVKAADVCHKNETKPDPFAHLYARICKTAPSSSPSTTSSIATSCSTSSVSVTASTSAAKDTDQSPDDVIYETLGNI
uniref:IRS-type PTB domain-containing protein n=1 Tax=Monopterus albus TaxID=43700 RepID=A0A3Q3JYW2_MONAL